jgi:hypothetical protein
MTPSKLNIPAYRLDTAIAPENFLLKFFELVFSR